MSQRKPKRKLSDISFEKEGAHVALVSKTQGGPANGHDYALVLKANKFSEEFIQKMQQVRITMELPDFLQKFFYLWEGDAKVLAYMMGYVEPADTAADEKMEAEEEFQDWIKSRMESFEVLKSAYEADSIPEFLSSVDEEQYLAMLKDQEKIEKALLKHDKESAAVEKSTKADTSIASEVNKQEVSASKDKQELEKSTMPQGQDNIEMVEKSALESIQKAFEEQKVALEKAMETIAQFEAEKKAAIEKARKEQIQAVLKDDAKAEVLFKAVKDAADEDFQAVVKALGDLAATVEKSALFQEQGASAQSEEPVKESPVAKLLKAKLQAGK